MALAEGTRLGRYTVRGVLGAGGLADVYDGWDTETDLPVALKVLDPVRRADTPGLLDRLHREAAALEALAHVPSVVRGLGVFHDEGTRCDVLVMERIDGETLAARAARQPPGARDALEWLGHACHALHGIHAAGWVHRDLKPDNLLLVDDPTTPLRVIDFNSAAPAAGAGQLTRAQGTFPNTPAYLAPECFAGAPPDTSADVYALALTFAEVLLGHHPLLPPGAPEPATVEAWGQVHRIVPFPDLTAVRQDVSPALQAALARASRGAPQNRTRDAIALWTDLKAAWDAGTSAPTRDPAPPTPTPAERRVGPPVGVLAALGVAGLVVFGLGALWLAAPSGPSRPEPAVTAPEAPVSAGPVPVAPVPVEAPAPAPPAPFEAPEEEVLRAALFARQRNQLRYCYQKRLTEEPTLSGNLVVAYTVQPDGAVTDASIAEDALGDPEVAACVLKAVRRAKLPEPSRAGVVHQPLWFARTDDGSVEPIGP